MEPFAHGLRDHTIFRTPHRINQSLVVEQPVPHYWKFAFPDEDVVEVVPLAEDTSPGRMPGWCTYVFEHEQAPELEVFCGGINAKTPKAGGLWRQGHLLHFGFDLSPAQMNDNGRALLVNSICYISRFTNDRPILRTPSVFYSGRRLVDRDAVLRLLAKDDWEPVQVRQFLSPELHASIEGKDGAEIERWYRGIRDYICAGKQGKLTVDDEARRFGISPARAEFLNTATAALSDLGDRQDLARTLLARYVPSGPVDNATPEAWRAWLDAHRPYLFFSDSGGYRWYIDPLAQSRGVPTESLRGPLRASPAVAK